ncbi:MAG TPA: RusA family crossover junction endodeoxyribonuclease [Acidimicrobiales bacterium]|nr:RusA family crossover junction endodeoxyribonuclease [Acidimicrobiales bacterium]
MSVAEDWAVTTSATGRLMIVVDGIPVPQGSKKIRPSGGKPGGRPVLVEDNDVRHRSWRAEVVAAARHAASGRPALLGPVLVSLLFRFPHPKYHYRTGRFAGVLKDGTPRFHSGTPDIDKLERHIFDALTIAGIYRDDGQVADGRRSKVYSERPGVTIIVESLG